MSDVIEELSLDVFGNKGFSQEPSSEENDWEVRPFPDKPFRANEDPEKSLVAHVLTSASGDIYLVAMDIAIQLGSDVKKRVLVEAQMATGDKFLLSISAITPKNHNNDWVSSAQSALKKSMSKMVRVSRASDSYRVIESQRPCDKAIWSDLTLEEIVEKAFGDQLITDMDHPAIIELLSF
jgi:hypothetical protein